MRLRRNVQRLFCFFFSLLLFLFFSFLSFSPGSARVVDWDREWPQLGHAQRSTYVDIHVSKPNLPLAVVGGLSIHMLESSTLSPAVNFFSFRQWY